MVGPDHTAARNRLQGAPELGVELGRAAGDVHRPHRRRARHELHAPPRRRVVHHLRPQRRALHVAVAARLRWTRVHRAAHMTTTNESWFLHTSSHEELRVTVLIDDCMAASRSRGSRTDDIEAAADHECCSGRLWRAWLQYSPMLSWNTDAGPRFSGDTLFACSKRPCLESRQTRDASTLAAAVAAATLERNHSSDLVEEQGTDDPDVMLEVQQQCSLLLVHSLAKLPIHREHPSKRCSCCKLPSPRASPERTAPPQSPAPAAAAAAPPWSAQPDPQRRPVPRAPRVPRRPPSPRGSVG